MIVRERISTGRNNLMELSDFLFWCLDGARQTYECDLPEGQPKWENLSDEDKMTALAHELLTQKGEFEIVNKEETFREFRKSDTFRDADVLSIVSIDGTEFDPDDEEMDSLIVLSARLCSGELEVVVE